MKIKCVSCGNDNPMHAKYCEYCGTKVLESDFDKAYKKSFYRKLELVDYVFGKITMSSILDSKLIKTILVLVLFIIGGSATLLGMNRFEIKDADGYDLTFDKSINRYVVTCDSYENIGLNLTLPKKAESVLLTTYKKSGELVESKEYSLRDSITFSDVNDSYYDISTGKKSIQVEFEFRGDK